MKKRYLYHYSAEVLVAGHVKNMLDGIVAMEKIIQNMSDYRKLKSAIRGNIKGGSLHVNSMSYIGKTLATREEFDV